MNSNDNLVGVEPPLRKKEKNVFVSWDDQFPPPKKNGEKTT